MPVSSFIISANEHLTSLKSIHEQSLAANDGKQLTETITNARIIRHALVVYRGSMDVLDLAEGTTSTADVGSARTYLRNSLPTLETALSNSQYTQLHSLATSVQMVLDELVVDPDNRFAVFDHVVIEEHDVARDNIEGDFSQNGTMDVDSLTAPPTKASSNIKNATHPTTVKKRTFTKRQKTVVLLYIIMIIGAIAAISIITINFVSELVDPNGVIQTTKNNSLLSPVVTTCLSQAGIPFSRLQLFNFTDANGVNFRGADPFDTFQSRASPEFRQVVERFWDNPDGEECNKTVGDFYPFPLVSLNRLTSGEATTKCRACYRVGLRREVYGKSTDFRNSSILTFYTDNYYLQCQKVIGGLNADSLSFLHGQLFINRTELFNLDILSSSNGAPPVIELQPEDFQSVTSVQACNIFYFAFFPKSLNKTDPDVDIRYDYDGEKWNRLGAGPYFIVKTDPTVDRFPTEALQMFVEDKESSRPLEIPKETDMILLGPNTQTFATFRRLIVFGSERYDISSSTSNLVQSSLTPLFGYWLVYQVYYNFNRFVTDEWYKESTYPAGQWVVDVLGYLGLFTGVSVFSLLLFPLMRTFKKMDRTKFLSERPEGYVWSRHRRLLRHGGATNLSRDGGASGPDPNAGTNSIVLPGYNV